MKLTDEKLDCYACHKTLEFSPNDKILRNEECPYCYASLRCCKMCKFYDKTAYNECREPSAERIIEKEKATFCDYFSLKGSQSKQDKLQEAQLAANALFKS